MSEIPDQIVLDEDETWPASKVSDLARLLYMGATIPTLMTQLSTSKRSINDRIDRYRLPQPRSAHDGFHHRQRGGGVNPGGDFKFDGRRIPQIADGKFIGWLDLTVASEYGLPAGALADARTQFNNIERAKVDKVTKRSDLKTDCLTDAEIDEVCELYGRGVYMSNICELFRIDHKVVERVVRYRGVCRPDGFVPNTHYPWSEQEREHLRVLAERGLSSIEIEQELGISDNTIRKEADRIGLALANSAMVKARKFEERFAAKYAIIKNMRLDGASIREISDVCEMTIGQVNHAIHKLVERGEIKHRQAIDWTPKRDEIAVIARGYKLHLRPITIAIRLKVDSELSITRVAAEEAIVHPCFQRPNLHVLRPEVLLHHAFDNRLQDHLQDVLTVHRRSIDAKDIDQALSRLERARKDFPEMAPWPHPSIAARAKDMRAHGRDKGVSREFSRIRAFDLDAHASA